MNPLLRFALLLCPREFREQYAAEIVQDARSGNAAFVVLDAVAAGLSMRAENAGRTLRTAFGSLLRAPLSSAVSVLSIALAIAANVAIVSVLEGVLFDRLPYAQANDLVFVSQYVKNFDVVGPSFPEAERIARESKTLSGIAVENGAGATLLGRGVPEQLNGRLVSLDYFRVLGVSPKLGRSFVAADSRSNAVLISDRLWRKYFNMSPAVLGASIRLKDYAASAKSYTVVGVLPQAFRDASRYGLRRSDYWILAVPGTMQTRPGRYFDSAVARLRPGVRLQAAQADISRVVSSLAQESPPGRRVLGRAMLAPVLQTIVGPVEPLLWTLYAAVAAVLLIACANVASLNFTRLIARERELAIRSALGASRTRLAAQVSVEAGMLAAAGAALGAGIGFAALRAFAAYGSAVLPRWENVRIDGVVVAYAIGITVLVTLATGILPAFFRIRGASARAGAPTGRSPGDTRSVKRAYAAFVVVEAALCIAVSVCAGIVLRSYVTLTHADIGFDPGPHTYDVQFYPLPPGRANDAVAKVRAIPGVTAVAASDDVPYANFTQNFTSVHVPSRPKDPAPMVEMIDADASYFDVMGMSLLRGRAISAQDRMSSSPVAIVNESFARSVLHASSPLGVHIVPDTYAGPHAVTRTIVGVVADIRDSRSQAPQPQIYVPLAQIGDPSQLVVRTNGNDAGLASAIQRIFEQADRENPPPVVVSFAGLFAQDTSAARGNTALFGGLALIALVLALAGMYAVAAYSAQRRTHEFGIRKAVGASDSAVLRNVLRASLAQMLAGICIGLILAAVGVRFLSGILYETSPLDPPTFLLVVVLFGACASTAALVPAMRAMRVNPVVALRYE